jgi:predicted dehydrogenase
MLRWLVIGIGDLTTKRVIPGILAEPRSEFYGVVTRDLRKAATYPGVRAWTSLDDALNDDAIDAVYVVSPVSLHAPQTIASLRAGKKVLCEKPVALHYAEAQSMAAAAKETGQLLGVAYFRRLFPKLMKTKRLIAEGIIGQPILAESNCHSWLNINGREWAVDPALAGGGPLYDIGSHRIDALNFLFGQPLKATGLRSNTVHQMNVEDSATAMIEYAGGVRGVIDVRWNSRIPRDQFRVLGTDGEIVLDALQGPDMRVNGAYEEIPPHSNVQYPLIENFASAALDGTPVTCPIEEAIWTDWVTEQVMRQR